VKKKTRNVKKCCVNSCVLFFVGFFFLCRALCLASRARVFYRVPRWAGSFFGSVRSREHPINNLWRKVVFSFSLASILILQSVGNPRNIRSFSVSRRAGLYFCPWKYLRVNLEIVSLKTTLLRRPLSHTCVSVLSTFCNLAAPVFFSGPFALLYFIMEQPKSQFGLWNSPMAVASPVDRSHVGLYYPVIIWRRSVSWQIFDTRGD